MKKELVLEIARMNQLMINEAIEPAAIKFVKSVIKEFPFEYKKLFTAFGAEEEQAMKTLEKRGAKAAEVETAVEKLLLKVNWGELANSLLKNKKLGGALDAFIEGKMKNVASGSITREEALRDIESVVETWTRNQGVPELGPELVKKLEQKLPDVSGVLGRDAEAIFNLVGKKMSQEQADFFNKMADKIKSLNSKDALILQQELYNITGNSGALQQAIDRLNQAGDIVSKAKADKFQKILNKIKDYLNISSKAVAGVDKGNLIKASIGIVVLLGLIGLYDSITKIPILGGFISGGVNLIKSWFSNSTSTEETW
jgi:hypothetical protein